MARAARYLAESSDGLEVLGAIIRALKEGRTRDDIASELASRGIEVLTAQEMIEYALALQAEYLRGQGKRDLIWGCILAAAGGGITYATWAAAAPGGSYFVLWGLVVWGGFRLLRGFYRCVKYAVDATARLRWVLTAALCVAAISLGGLALDEQLSGTTDWTAPSDTYITWDDESYWASESQSLFSVEGTVRNTHSEYSVRSVCIEVCALSENDEVICKKQVSVDPTTLRPGGVGTYSAILSLPQECMQAEWQLVWEWVP